MLQQPPSRITQGRRTNAPNRANSTIALAVDGVEERNTALAYTSAIAKKIIMILLQLLAVMMRRKKREVANLK